MKQIIIDNDFWTEVLQTIMLRRSQSLMTAFGVFWGILLLALLLGTSKGLNNGILSKVTTLPPNELLVRPDATSMAYRGFGRDRMWKLNADDEKLIRRHYGRLVIASSPVCFVGYQTVVRGDLTYQYQVTGVGPQFKEWMPQRLTAGRFINELDMREHRKVCVVGERVADMLFDSYEEAVGSTISVSGISLMVVGITHCTNRHINIGIDVSESVFMPLPTVQVVYGRGDEVDLFSVIMDDAFPMRQQKKQLVDIIKENHTIHPDDELAVLAPTVEEETIEYRNLIVGTNALIWIVGLGTLIAGLIGITNIMLVSVRERTQEIGIRRAIGAKPHDILLQIMLESLVLTIGAGLAGLCVAVWVLFSVDNMLPSGDDTIFLRLSIPFWTAVVSLLILIAGGLLAGWMPARRALAIKPIDALREE